MTLREAVREYRKCYPNDPHISESSIWRMKPFFVKQASQRDLEQCCCQLCIVCTSAEKSFRALMDYRKRKNSSDLYDEVHSMVSSTLCPKVEGQAYKEKCLKRQCQICGVKLL